MLDQKRDGGTLGRVVSSSYSYQIRNNVVPDLGLAVADPHFRAKNGCGHG